MKSNLTLERRGACEEWTVDGGGGVLLEGECSVMEYLDLGLGLGLAFGLMQRPWWAWCGGGATMEDEVVVVVPRMSLILGQSMET